MASSAYDTIISYHQATKHHFHRYARSLGYMDWANQPNPFRQFDGAPKIPLPLAEETDDMPFEALFGDAKGEPRPLNLDSLGAFLENALGLSAWKVAGTSRWSLRINPSSGNLHPTEGYLILPSLGNLQAGVFHYAPLEHQLEQRAQMSTDQWDALTAPGGVTGFFMALTSIHWRESWKYGERAYRYCSLDIGHALAAIGFAAGIHRWRMTCLWDVGDDQLATMLGLDLTSWHPQEAEVPDTLCWISSDPAAGPTKPLPVEQWQTVFASLEFKGRPKPLSRQPVSWQIIDEAAKAAAKPATVSLINPSGHQTDGELSAHHLLPAAKTTPAREIIRKRRSAVGFDPQRSNISQQHFRSMLAMTLPRRDSAMSGFFPAPPAVHLLLFVHRVRDLPPGLYLLIRGADQQSAVKAALRSDFKWQRVWPGFPLWCLQQVDMTYDAMEVSCHQDIAGNSAFAVAMLAEFEKRLRPAPFAYRHLHWECGMIGQILYLAAEAYGMRGTGIGCFFDDAVHRLAGIDHMDYQTLYHFTVGYPVDDSRLTTLPGYDHLKR